MPAAILASGCHVLKKCGANSLNRISGADFTNEFLLQAEGFINSATRYNWNDNYTALNADVKGVLEEAASNLAATYMINYDMSGYTSRTEAELMINLLLVRANQCLQVLIDKKAETFVKGA
jgi:hypothetical protein